MISRKVEERIASIPQDKFLNSLVWKERDVVWWLFEIKNPFGKISKSKHLWTKDKYIMFIRKLSKPKVKRPVFLKLVNEEKDEKDDDS